jgi:hypothetical protein
MIAGLATRRTSEGSGAARARNIDPGLSGAVGLLDPHGAPAASSTSRPSYSSVVAHISANSTRRASSPFCRGDRARLCRAGLGDARQIESSHRPGCWSRRCQRLRPRQSLWHHSRHHRGPQNPHHHRFVQPSNLLAPSSAIQSPPTYAWPAPLIRIDKPDAGRFQRPQNRKQACGEHRFARQSRRSYHPRTGSSFSAACLLAMC